MSTEVVDEQLNNQFPIQTIYTFDQYIVSHTYNEAFT